MKAIRSVLPIAALVLTVGTAEAQSLRDQLSGIIDITGNDAASPGALCDIAAADWGRAIPNIMSGDWKMRAGHGVEQANGQVRRLEASGESWMAAHGDGQAVMLSGSEMPLLTVAVHNGSWPFGSRGAEGVAGGEMLATGHHEMPSGCASAHMPRLSGKATIADARGAGEMQLYLYLRTPSEAQGAVVTELTDAQGRTSRSLRLIDLTRVN